MAGRSRQTGTGDESSTVTSDEIGPQRQQSASVMYCCKDSASKLKTTNMNCLFPRVGSPAVALGLSQGCSQDAGRGCGPWKAWLGLEDLLWKKFSRHSGVTQRERAAATAATAPLSDLLSKVSHGHFCFILFLRIELPSQPVLRERGIGSLPSKEGHQRISEHVFLNHYVEHRTP